MNKIIRDILNILHLMTEKKILLKLSAINEHVNKFNIDPLYRRAIFKMS